MKKLAAVASLSLLAVLIVLPAACSVNYILSNSVVADGAPLPLPPAVASANYNAVLVADGAPLPLPPTADGNAILMADGAPLPLPPTAEGNAILTADGAPLALPPSMSLVA